MLIFVWNVPLVFPIFMNRSIVFPILLFSSICLHCSSKKAKANLNDPDNHDGVMTHLELDILECEVKWAFGSITMNKASGGGRILAELFELLKDGAVKCCTQYVSKFGELSSGDRTGKGQFSFPSWRSAMPKNVPTIIQLHSFHTLARLCSKSWASAVHELRNSRCKSWI